MRCSEVRRVSRQSASRPRPQYALEYGAATGFSLGRTYVLPTAPGSVLFDVPPSGFRTEAELAALGAR